MRIAAVILAAGMGTRLRPLTDAVPKCLVPLGGRPLIEQALESLWAGGVERVVVVSGYRAPSVTDAVGEDRRVASGALRRVRGESRLRPDRDRVPLC